MRLVCFLTALAFLLIGLQPEQAFAWVDPIGRIDAGGGSQCQSRGSYSYDGCTVHLNACCDPSPFMVGGLGIPNATTGEANTPIDPARLGEQLEVVPRIFSAVVCQVESLSGEVFGSTWCIIRDAMKDPLLAVLMLYVVITGLVFTLGLRPMRASDLVVIVLKMVLVWLFATEADFAIGIMYRFYMYLLKDGIAVVLASGFTDTSHGSGHILHNIDAMFSQIFMRDSDGYFGRGVGGLMMGLLLVIYAPFGGVIGPAIVSIAFMTFMVFVRTILSYMIAIVGIGFYLALAPIFLCFALFKQTFNVFQSWMSQVVSLALQPVIIFAYLMMIEAYMENFDIMQVINMLMCQGDFQPDAMQASAGTSGVSLNSMAAVFRQNCGDSGDTTTPYFSGQIAWDGDLGGLMDILQSIGGLALINFATVKFLEMVPMMARQLTTLSGRAIKIGGGMADPASGKGMSAPGENALQNTMARIGALRNQGVTDNAYIQREAGRAFFGDFASRFTPAAPSNASGSSWGAQWWGGQYNPEAGYGGSVGRVIQGTETRLRPPATGNAPASPTGGSTTPTGGTTTPTATDG